MIFAFVPSTIIFLLGVVPPQRLIGPHDLLADIVPPAALGTLGMTLVVTLIIRSRVAKNLVEPLVGADARRGLFRYIAAPLPLRMGALALVAVITCAVPAFLLVAAMHLIPFSALGLFGFNIIYGGAIGAFMTPLVVRLALADGVT
jgi:hypothetical protein